MNATLLTLLFLCSSDAFTLPLQKSRVCVLHHHHQVIAPCLPRRKQPSLLRAKGTGSGSDEYDRKERQIGSSAPHIFNQAAITIGSYLFHVFFISQKTIPFSPSQSIGLDTVTGLCLLAMGCLRRQKKPPPLPYKFPSADSSLAKKSQTIVLLLLSLFFITSFLHPILTNIIYFLSALGVPISIGMHRSIGVLISHLAWVIVGVRVLQKNVDYFFANSKNPKGDKWYTIKFGDSWGLWATYGYYISCSLFNILDGSLNTKLLRLLGREGGGVVGNESGGGIVNMLVNPENGDIAAR